MTEKQFSIGIKITITLAIIAFIAMIVMVVMTLKPTNASSSVLDDVTNSNKVVTNEIV